MKMPNSLLRPLLATSVFVSSFAFVGCESEAEQKKKLFEMNETYKNAPQTNDSIKLSKKDLQKMMNNHKELDLEFENDSFKMKPVQRVSSF